MQKFLLGLGTLLTAGGIGYVSTTAVLNKQSADSFVDESSLEAKASKSSNSGKCASAKAHERATYRKAGKYTDGHGCGSNGNCKQLLRDWENAKKAVNKACK